jgi:hypothetical protein
MATELDKLLVKMGLKEDNTMAGSMAALGATAGLPTAVRGAILANPNDFGGRGKASWKKALEPIIAGADGKMPQGFSSKQRHMALGSLGLIDKLGRMGKVKRNLLMVGLPSAVGAGVMGMYGYGAGKLGDLILAAQGKDTKWRDKEDIMKSILDLGE